MYTFFSIDMHFGGAHESLSLGLLTWLYYADMFRAMAWCRVVISLRNNNCTDIRHAKIRYYNVMPYTAVTNQLQIVRGVFFWFNKRNRKEAFLKSITTTLVEFRGEKRKRFKTLRLHCEISSRRREEYFTRLTPATLKRTKRGRGGDSIT